MTVKVSHAQRALINALAAFPGGAGNLDLTQALRGPLREPTVAATERAGYVEKIGIGSARKLKLTEKGRRMAGIDT